MKPYYCKILPSDPRYADIKQRHDAAVQFGHRLYKEGGWSVATSEALFALGRCCGSDCRHCPFKEGNKRDEMADRDERGQGALGDRN